MRTWQWTLDPLRLDFTDRTRWRWLIHDVSTASRTSLCPVGAIDFDRGYLDGWYALIVVGEDGRPYELTEDGMLLPLRFDPSGR
ncbi:MAG TPA: hypothetical protein VHB77_01375, partial [Planctomycetaceae bacterium]|nr:hypothetical protein [Planctomycetaceae bacterium]